VVVGPVTGLNIVVVSAGKQNSFTKPFTGGKVVSMYPSSQDAQRKAFAAVQIPNFAATPFEQRHSTVSVVVEDIVVEVVTSGTHIRPDVVVTILNPSLQLLHFIWFSLVHKPGEL